MKVFAITLLAAGVVMAVWDRNFTAAVYAACCILLILDLRWWR